MDIPVKRSYGVFDDLHDVESGRQLSDKLQSSCKKYHGQLGLAFIRSLIDSDLDGLGDLLETIKGGFSADSSQEGRGADRFAVLALAGEMAIDYGLLPWEQGDATKAASVMFESWKQNRGKGNTEDRQILTMVASYLEKYGDARFTNLNPAPSRYSGEGEEDNRLHGGIRSGYWVVSGDQRKYRFNRDGLQEATAGYDLARVKQALVAAAWLTSDIAKPAKTPEGTKRLYEALDIKWGE